MLHTLQHIMVPVDNTSRSLRSVEAAIGIAKRNRAQVHLAHIVRERDVTQACCPTNSPRGHLDFTRWLTGVIRDKFAMEPTWHNISENTEDAMMHWLKEHPCDLIVTSSPTRNKDGATGSDNMLATHLLQHATCPVLLLPATGGKASFSKVLYAAKPYSGAMSQLKWVAPITGTGISVEILLLGEQQEVTLRNTHGMLADEAKKEASGIKLQWNSNGYKGLPLLQQVGNAAVAAKADLLVLTPSLANWNCIGHIDADIAAAIPGIEQPVLYLLNSSFYQAKREMTLLSSF